MKRLPLPLRLSLAGALLFSCASFAGDLPLRFDGVPFEAQTVQLQQLEVNAAGVLAIDLGPQGVASITPWPEALPRRLGRQQVEIGRTLHPAGAIYSLDLLRPRSKTPWLMMTANGPFRRELLPGYRLERNDGGSIYLQTPGAQLPLQAGKALGFRDRTRRCWQLTLLAVRIPPAVPGIAQEAEPRADWYLRNDLGCGK